MKKYYCRLKMKLSDNKSNLLLLIILFLALFLRFYKLTDYPVGFHIDEASIGYNAYSILKTGKDEWGNFLPLQFKAFGDWPPAGYVYLVAFFESFLGLKEIAVRLPAAIIGTLTVWLFYFLTRKLFLNFTSGESSSATPEALAAAASFLLAVSPWHIVLSRSSSEDVVSNFLILLGMFFLIKEKKQPLLSFFMFILSFYFYFSSRVLAPLILIGFYFLFYKKSNEKKKILKLLTAVFIFLALATCLSQNTRFKTVSIFGHLENKLIIEEQIREDGQLTINPLAARLFHNKLIKLSKAFLTEYGKYFTFDFLILKGGLPIRYQIANTGLILVATFIFALLGLLRVAGDKSSGLNSFLIWLIIISPIAGALTWENSPNIRRASFLLFGLVLLQALGWQFLTSLKKKVWLAAILAVLIFEFMSFGHQATVHARMHKPWYRNYGYEQMIQYLSQIEKNYEKVYISEFDGDPYIFFLFYNKSNPVDFQNASKDKPARLAGENKEKWQWEDYIFIRQDCPLIKDRKVLIVGKGDCQIPEDFKSLYLFYRPDSSPVFHLYSYAGK